MTIGLVYNPKAGDASAPSRERLIRIIEDHGHHVAVALAADEDWSPLFVRPLDAIAAAGGDGTVAGVARALVGRPTALLVLPMGTANNVAATLGQTAPLADLIAGWRDAVAHPLDLVRTTGPWGERLAIESVGGGLIAHGIVVMERQVATDASRTAAIQRARANYAEVLASLLPTRWEITVDGDAIVGDFLMVEALNMRTIGPRVVPALDVDWSDGYLSVVLADASCRSALLSHFSNRESHGHVTPLALPARRARTVVIRRSDRLHVDDEVFVEVDGPGIVTVEVQPGAIRALLPSQTTLRP